MYKIENKNTSPQKLIKINKNSIIMIALILISLTIIFSICMSTSAAQAPLSINNTDPTDGASNEPINTTINVNFNKPIQAGSAYNSINVKSDSGTAYTLIKTINGNTLTLAAKYGFAQGTTYTINIPKNAITDLTGTGIATTTTSTFTTDPGPTITSINPNNNTKNLPTSQVITINFDNQIQAGSAYNSINVKSDSGTAYTLIKTINGNTLTLAAKYGFAQGTTYTINIPKNAITDLTGTGIATTTTSTFTTDPGPTITSINPNNNTKNLPTSQVITINFDNQIQAGSAYNSINVKSDSGTAYTLIKTINGNTLTLAAKYGFAQGTTYTINIPKNAITDLTGTGIATTTTSTFTTDPGPTITSINPNNNTKNLPTSQVITINFDNQIQAGSAYNSINVKSDSGTAYTLIKTINGNTLTLAAKYGFAQGTTYTINIPKNAITDLTGTGIATTTTSTFTTDPGPTIIDIYPNDGTFNVPKNQVITINFDNQIQAGSAYNSINVKSYSGTAYTLIKTINGNTLTLTAKYGWKEIGKYTITIPQNAIVDITGTGIATTTSSFSTNGPVC